MDTLAAPSSGRRRRGRLYALVAAAVAAVVVIGVVNYVPSSGAETTKSDPAACPAVLKEKAKCYTGQDDNGAYYTMAVPHDWNGSLVVHAHGGPDFSYDESTSTEDLELWAVMVEEGYAWAASSYRRGGYGVRMAAADTENVRRLFVEDFGRPERTFLHGQSWGGNIAAKAAEIYGGRKGRYDGVMTTNGFLAGGTRGYNTRLDLRVVYQYYCRNLPRPSEKQYPLWQGLPADSKLTPEDVAARVAECTGVGSDPAKRTAQQRRNLKNILAVTRTTEETLPTNMLYATFLFQDIVSKRLDGRNPFTNRGIRYEGSHDDKALNAGVARFSADPTAKRDFSYDTDLTGRISIPVLTMHAIGDPQVFVEHEAAYEAAVRTAQRDENLMQTFTKESEHGELSTAEYATILDALDTWASTGRKPTTAAIARSCASFDTEHGGGCHFDPAFRPEPFHTKVSPRPGDRRWPAMSATRERIWSKIDGVGIAP
ncbi:DUF6351 family protein [Streptomyces sp. NPDC096048]|uniref:DUF6351 family protein n=1 Tax=Streptomyces sp. NPDC096048 TaxID=3366072 RepID=UPI0038069DBE